MNYTKLAQQIKLWAKEIGFLDVGITNLDLTKYEKHLQNWLKQGYQAKMEFMNRYETKRINPAELIPNTKSIICVTLRYSDCNFQSKNILQSHPSITQHAKRRDYHKIIRKKLQKLADKISEQVGEFKYRAFCDSGPVFEKALAEKSGLGWIGKNTCLISKSQGSQIFLGELYTDLPLPTDQPMQNNCGSCKKCLTSCPTKAFVSPYVLNANLCISYLTIEHKGSIPIELRPLIGTRIFGCDECQTACPWNNFINPIFQNSTEKLIEFFAWDEETFLQQTAGTVIRRLGHERWLRNIAIALGNSPANPAIIKALQSRLNHPSAIVREHVQWAIEFAKALP